MDAQDAEKGSLLGRQKEHRALVTKIVVHESKEVASQGAYIMVCYDDNCIL